MATNYFDRLSARPLTFAPTDSPLPASMSGSAPTMSARPEMQQPAQQAAQPQQAADPWAGLEDDGQFVDLGPAPSQQPAPQAQAQPQAVTNQAMAAQSNNSVDAAGWDVAKSEQARQEIAQK